MNKIQRVSLFFRVLFQIGFIVIPVFTAVCWIYAPQPLHLAIFTIDTIPQGYPILAPFTPTTRILGFLITLLPATVEMLVLYFLIKLFQLYERGEIFMLENVRYLRNIGYILLIGQLINPIYDGLITANITWRNHFIKKGTSIAAVTFDGTNISFILMALLVILISWIMAEGGKLREEQQLTI